jgi:hypothetical protein
MAPPALEHTLPSALGTQLTAHHLVPLCHLRLPCTCQRTQGRLIAKSSLRRDGAEELHYQARVVRLRWALVGPALQRAPASLAAESPSNRWSRQYA